MNPAILRLMHLRDQVDAVGETMAIERGRFDRLANRETRAVSAFNLFQTPEIVAAHMVDQLPPLAGKRILEPSAGLGRLYAAIRNVSCDCSITLVENAPQCAAELYQLTAPDDAAQLVQADFLACDRDRLGGGFDVVLMNPPFKLGTDIKHIEHALTLLNPGGTLVSLCYAGSKQRAAFENSPRCSWSLLPPASFKESGTRADVAMVVFE